MLIRTKRLKSGTGEISYGLVCLFEQDEIRFLAAHLGGAQPKLTWHGTIGQGLTVWFEAKGLALWDANSGRALEATIPCAHLAGVQAMRMATAVNVERITYQNKPALQLEAQPYFDKAAESFNAVIKAESLFKPAAPAPKPELSSADVSRIVAKHSGKTLPVVGNTVLAAASDAAPNIELPPVPPKPALIAPTLISSGNVIEDLKAAIEIVNMTMENAGDDIILGVSNDRRKMQVFRRRVVTEEVSA